MSFLARLRDFVEEMAAPEEGEPDDSRLTVAALLALVVRVDGRVLDVEEAGLRTLLKARFGLSEAAAVRLLAQVDAMADEVDQAKALADRILLEIDSSDRPAILALAYRIAAIDGYLHEFEDDLIWRIGRLLGQSDSAIAAVREEALANLAPERARDG
jgi:uncharacterized tellurite resistance protein B-like protein